MITDVCPVVDTFHPDVQQVFLFEQIASGANGRVYTEGLSFQSSMSGDLDMDLTYDIFKWLPDSTPLWVEAVVGLEQARKRLKHLAEVESANYLIYDPRIATFIESHAASSAVHTIGPRDNL